VLLVCLAIIGNLSRISDFNQVRSWQDKLEGVIVLIIFICIYIGLRLRSKWVVPLILFSSAFGLLSSYVHGTQPASSVLDLVSKSVEIMYILSPLPENPSLSRLGMKAARSEAEAESPLLFLAETTGFSPCAVHLSVILSDRQP